MMTGLHVLGRRLRMAGRFLVMVHLMVMVHLVVIMMMVVMAPVALGRNR